MGTKDRAYCKEHEQYAFDQAKQQSRSKSALNDMLAHEHREQFLHEKRMGAV